jgi:hypothetical protein
VGERKEELELKGCQDRAGLCADSAAWEQRSVGWGGEPVPRDYLCAWVQMDEEVQMEDKGFLVAK